MTTEQIRKALVETKKISPEYFERVLTTAQSEQVPVESVIVREKLLKEEDLGQAIAESAGYNFVDLNHESIQNEYLEYLPESVAISQQAIIFNEDDKKIKVATVNPSNFKLIKDLEKVTGKDAEVYYAPPSALEKFLLYYKNNLPQDFKDFVNEFAKTKNDDVIVKMVDRLIQYSYENKASDIHIEPNKEDVDIRVRIDGILRRVAS
jgi:type IV pilus assembly protein PilB